MFEFLADSISPENLVLGRNCDRDIPAGTTFTSIRHSRVHEEADQFRTEDLGEAGRIALTLCGFIGISASSNSFPVDTRPGWRFRGKDWKCSQGCSEMCHGVNTYHSLPRSRCAAEP